MKLMMIIGGLLGFLIGIGFGLAQQGPDWSSILWRASLAMYAGGMLMRWWGKQWVRSLQQANEQRLAMSHTKPEAISIKSR